MDSITIIPSMLKGSVKIYATEDTAVYTLLCAALKFDKCKVENILLTKRVNEVLEKLKKIGYKYTYNGKSEVLTISPKKNSQIKVCEKAVNRLFKKMFPNDKPCLDFTGENRDTLTAEGDFKKAALFLVADALGCDVECIGVKGKSRQKNGAILEIIQKAGGITEETEKGIKVRRTACMKGISVNAENLRDLVPVIAVLLCFCEGESRISGAGHMRMEKGDKLATLVRELSHLGGDVRETSDGMIIHGTGVLRGDTACVNGDGELALSLTVAACRCESQYFTVCDGKSEGEKLFENFFEIYKGLEW